MISYIYEQFVSLAGCYRYAATVSPTGPNVPSLNVRDEPVYESVQSVNREVAFQSVSNMLAQISNDSQPSRVEHAATNQRETAIAMEIAAESGSVNPAVTDQTVQHVVPDCTAGHLRWLITNQLYNGPIPRGILEDD